jgi:hypothetical protein
VDICALIIVLIGVSAYRIYKGTYGTPVSCTSNVIRPEIVKQDMFMSEVSTCFNALRRMVADIHLQAADVDLQMANPTARYAVRCLRCLAQ